MHIIYKYKWFVLKKDNTYRMAKTFPLTTLIFSLKYIHIFFCLKTNQMLNIYLLKLTCCYSIAGWEWISFITWITSTVRIMILYRTGCMYTTHTWTGINTLLVNTSQGCGTLLVYSTFWFAFNVRVSKQAR